MKKFLAALLAILLVMTVFAACNRKEDSDSGVGDYEEITSYDIKDSTGKVLGTITYRSQGTDYAVITNYTPRISGPHSVVIPEVFPTSELTVVGIGDEAFKACTSVTSVTLPDTVETIGEWAFSLCTSIYEINVPEAVESIGKGAFTGCSSLTYVNFKGDKPALTTIDKYAFNDCDVMESIAIPEGVTSIGDAAFLSCEALKTVTLPQTLETLGQTVFADCENIEKITLGDNLKEAGVYAFGTLKTDNPDALVYKEGTTTDKTVNSTTVEEE